MVRTEQSGSVRTVILDRPQARNAVDGPTAHALAAAFRALDADESVAAAVLWGDHGTFCAGADLKQMSNPLEDDLSADAPMGPSRLALTKPVVAAISGHAVAGGLELALWCDLRVMESDATLGVFCRRWGVPLIDGGTVRLPQIVGLGRALDLILTGRPVHADEALAMGLVNRVVAPGEARAAAEALAAEIARFPQACVRSDRASVHAALGRPTAEALATEFASGRAVLADAADGAARFAAGAGRGGSFDA
ncbi:MAG: crotonase/enoyl-CoA hydratase family protein [Jatrophihabitans sp.]|uniref:crotonase/enoyl-CoA hydratase family protein n=1 Tax=Jatrophihabitans sp. TaxID=1932789 RepID=UPI003F818FFD